MFRLWNSKTDPPHRSFTDEDNILEDEYPNAFIIDSPIKPKENEVATFSTTEENSTPEGSTTEENSTPEESTSMETESNPEDSVSSLSEETEKSPGVSLPCRKVSPLPLDPETETTLSATDENSPPTENDDATNNDENAAGGGMQADMDEFVKRIINVADQISQNISEESARVARCELLDCFCDSLHLIANKISCAVRSFSRSICLELEAIEK